MDKLLITGLMIGGGFVVYKAGIYITAYYKLKKEKRQKVVDLGNYAEYKKRLNKFKK